MRPIVLLAAAALCVSCMPSGAPPASPARSGGNTFSANVHGLRLQLPAPASGWTLSYGGRSGNVIRVVDPQRHVAFRIITRPLDGDWSVTVSVPADGSCPYRAREGSSVNAAWPR